MVIYSQHWLVLDGINPEPWRIGPLSTGYGKGGGKFPKIGRDQQLFEFEQAVADAVKAEWGDKPMLEGKVQFTVYLWRRRDEYTTPSERKHRKHEADGTNMQKAIEDALQGVIFDNDRDNSSGKFVIMDQSADCEPAIVIEIGLYEPLTLDDLPGHVRDRLFRNEGPSDNAWTGPS